MTTAQHTPGPWRWEFNEEHKNLALVGGKPQFDLTIIQPTRWGMSSATLFVRDTAHDGMNLLHKVHERRDWIQPFPGRAHHVRWCAAVTHPDMRLIESAPELLAALHTLTDAAGQWIEQSEQLQSAYLAARSVIAKATGSAS